MVVCTDPAHTQAIRASVLAPHLENGQVVFLLFPVAHPVENALSVALLNVGPIIHSVLFLLNIGAIEHFSIWDIHNEGTTASVKKLVLAHDAERIAMRKTLGFSSHHYPFDDHYNPASKSEWMYGRKAHTDLVKSEKWRESLDFRHRYILEDVKCNLALMASIGDFCREETPIADALLTLIGTISGENFRQTGRTLTALGVGDLSPEELTNVLWGGFVELLRLYERCEYLNFAGGISAGEPSQSNASTTNRKEKP